MREALRGLKKYLFSRTVVVGALFLIHTAVFLLFILRLTNYFAAMYGVFVLISALVLLHIINRDLNPMYKISWIIPVLIFPLFGSLFYLICGNCRLSKYFSRRMEQKERQANLPQHFGAAAKEAVSALPASRGAVSQYITNFGYPPFINTGAEYLSPGEAMLQRLLPDIQSAKRYIYMEYFIIAEGRLWDAVLPLLEQKASEGVDVRIIYDSFGCIATLPDNYYKELRKRGLRCIEFNPPLPFYAHIMNNRDHRKITAIDGRIGYMGGINLADEYINQKSRFGHWKDCAVRLEGEAVISLASMFAVMWNSLSDDAIAPEALVPSQPLPARSDILIQPYSDTPLDNEQLGRGIYLGMISRAERSVCICTPYFIVDNELLTALLLAAKSGVRIKIITPGQGDKWYVHLITRSYYRRLIEGGIEVYEYTPGFIHSKLVIADGETASVGTVNLDFRSLYLHFECGVWLCGSGAVSEIQADFDKTLQSCERITGESPLLKLSAAKRLLCAVIRAFSPLM